MAMPLAGNAIAIFFYEYVFIKSREYLDDDDEPETGSDKNEFSALKTRLRFIPENNDRAKRQLIAIFEKRFFNKL